MPHHSGKGSVLGSYPRLLLCTALMWLGLLTPVKATIEAHPAVFLATSENVSLDSPSQKELAAIFLGQKRYWKDGTRVKIAILESQDEQQKFLNVVADRSPRQYWAHWRNIVFSGRGVMPKIFETEEELLGYLEKEEGAIGQIVTTDLAESKGAVTLTIDGALQP